MSWSRVKKVVLWSATVGLMVYGFGGCSLRSIGAGLLSEFLTTGGTSTIDSVLQSGLDSLLSQGTAGSTS